jgi:ubiquinone/menaquinone biosynthesis C-methylase UbiE
MNDIDKEMDRWEREQGVKFLKNIGIQNNQTVLDFGARVGHYSIPAAIAVGNKGVVYAIDKDQEALNKLKQKAISLNLKNIKIIKNSGEVELKLKDKSVDAVLLYDVLHFFKKTAREMLYSQAHRVLKPDSLISIYPKHISGDDPSHELKTLSLDDVKQEVQESGFIFEEKYCGNISHDDSLNHGCVLNFRK